MCGLVFDLFYTAQSLCWPLGNNGDIINILRQLMNTSFFFFDCHYVQETKGRESCIINGNVIYIMKKT